MRKIKDVLRLKFEVRLSHEKIAAATGRSKGAVTNAVRRAAQKGLSWPLPAELDDNRLEAMLHAQAAPRGQYAQPDYARVPMLAIIRATVPRRASLGLRSCAVREHQYFRPQRADSRARTPRSRTGSARMAASISPSARFQPDTTDSVADIMAAYTNLSAKARRTASSECATAERPFMRLREVRSSE
jgi:hypothetical protein